MLNTRDKILISLTAVLQAVYGAVFIYRMFAWKTLIAGGESDLLELEISLAALFAVTVIFSVIMRNLPAKIYSLPALCCPLLFQLAAVCGFAGSAYDSDWNVRFTAAGVIAIIAFAVIMRDLPSKTYVIPAFSMPMIFLIAGFLGTGADFDAAGVAHMTAGGTASVIIFAVGTAGIVTYELCTAFKKNNN